MKRLLDFAKKATKGKTDAIHDFRALGLALEESSATITNWKSRGVSRDGALKAERIFGCAASWVLDGEGAAGEPKMSSDPMQSLDLLSPEQVYDLMMVHLQDVQKLARTLIEKRSSPTKGAQNSPATGEQVSNFTTPKSFQANGRHTSIPHKKTGSGRHK